MSSSIDLSHLPASTNLKNSLRGMHVALDGTRWIFEYRGRWRRLRDVSHQTFANHVVQRVKCLRAVGARVKLVFDGAYIPSWHNYNQPTENYKLSTLEGPYFDEQVADIVYDIIQDLQNLKDDGVSYMVAPNEANSQLAYLATKGLVDVVITNNTDLIFYGCPRIFYQLDLKTWVGMDINTTEIMSNLAPGFNRIQILEAMLLSGCVHYLQSLPDFSSAMPTRETPFKLGVSLIRKYRSYKEIVKRIRVPLFDQKSFANRVYSFLHQKVYKEDERKIDYLTPIVDSDKICEETLFFLGNAIDPITAREIIIGTKYPVYPYEFIKGYYADMGFDSIDFNDDFGANAI